ncbi:hypothetical protein Pyn_36764 [Prunus yedoensis var. nudiflora]|uniref:Protein NRT1/ PTR FAMILY 5.5 n=2 Tax=Prunus yedoensis var. nudiflora TaxID=2094558 RepID=A0A314Z5X7_PRUYE|nr:hypothetical protein Pyn_36764 [Prunus yedoensis var. nudiflora]
MQGFGALALSTPPMLGWATGTCTAYEAECIGPVQKILFYTALPLIAVGIIGQATSLVQLAHDERPQWLGPLTFTAPITWLVLSAQDQTTPESGLSSSSVMIAQLTALSRSARGQTPESNGPFVFTPGMRGLALAAVCILGYVTSWSIKYGVSALVIIMAAFSFVALSPCSYKRVKGQGVPVKWKETKTILLVTLVGALFVAMSVVSAIGNTYFVLQASHLNQKVWFVKFPLPILLFAYNQARSKFGGLKRSVAAISIGLAASMVLASLCCVVAALVEARRLAVVKSSGLIDLPDETIPMTMFWLVPQFVLLGCADGIFSRAIGSLYMVALISDEEAENLEASKVLQCQYAGFYDMAVYGVGVMGSVLSVHVVGEISAEGGKINWFQHTLNTSRLDNYYWTLAALVAINLLIFFVLTVCCGACFYVVSRFKDAKLPAAPAVDEPLLQ